MPTLYDAARCPYCARVRIALAEKGIAYDPIEIDLDDRPAWLYDLNSTGRVPVLDDDGFVLPESLVIMEYLEDRFPQPSLRPPDAADLAFARLLCARFDDLGEPYYDLMRNRAGGSRERLDAQLARLDALLAERPFLSGAAYGIADVVYVPWILRSETRLGIDVRRHERIAAWLARLEERPAVREELDLVARSM